MSSRHPRTPADFALQWLRNQPEVSVVLSGMSAMEHLVENVESAGHSGVGTLSPEELAVIDRMQEQYQALCAIPSTRCQYCLPCPSDVAIPDIFEIYNDLLMYGDNGRARLLTSPTRVDTMASVNHEKNRIGPPITYRLPTRTASWPVKRNVGCKGRLSGT